MIDARTPVPPGNAIFEKLGGKPEYGSASDPGDGKVYANLTDISEVVEIDAKTAIVTRRWSTGACKQPVSMALDTAHHRLFNGCRSGVMMAVSDYQAGKGGCHSSPDRHRRRRRGIRCCLRQRVCLKCRWHAHRNSSGHCGPVSRNRKRADAAMGSRNMGLDPTNHRVFPVSAKFGPAPAGGRGRAPVLPGSFALMVIERDPATR